jgi:hypothetical protein
MLLRVKLLRRAVSTTVSRLSASSLPPDVDPVTGLCSGGLVRVAPCESEAKGFGAFATSVLEPDQEIGRYAGELITLGELLARYGGGGEDEYEQANAQAAWAAERQARGVTVTGQYVYNVGACPETRRIKLLDAEDPLHAHWTRFINHSERRPNLSAVSEFANGVPLVKFIVKQPIAPGSELLFDYGDGFGVDVLDFED